MYENNLFEIAKAVTAPRKLSEVAECGTVGCALLSASGKVFTGISLDAACGVGACAEFGAVAEMLKSGESRVTRIMAVSNEGVVFPPCGRCRELLFQIDKLNLETEVFISANESKTLRELLPHLWLI